MPNVIILDDYQRVALDSADWSAVQRLYQISVLSKRIDNEDDLVDALSEGAVIVAMRERTPLPWRLLERLPQLRLIVTTGMRNAAIDIDAANRLGITVSGTTSSTNSVSELTIGMMVALPRNFVAEDNAIRAGGWQHTIGHLLSGKTLGVVGLGRIGVRVAAIAQALNMEVIAWSPNLTPERAAPQGVEAVSKPNLFERADIVTIHMPLSERTRGLIRAAELHRMKSTAYLINTSRGPIVDEQSLIDALQQHRIAGAALDVYHTEPLAAGHPLRTIRNTLLLPHIGYVTVEGYNRWYTEAVEDIVAWHSGQPVRLLTKR